MFLELYNKVMYDFIEVFYKWVCIMLWSMERYIILVVFWEV